MPKTLKTAVLGAGFMGRNHALNAARQPDVSVVAVCAATIPEAQAVTKDLPGSKPYDDFAAMLAEHAPDVLLVAIPPFAHNGQIEAAAAKGIHLFMEKPLALGLDRARAMVAAAQKAGVKTSMGFHMRFYEPVRRMKALIAEGRAGKPTLFQGRYFCNHLHVPWWRNAAQGGGQVLEQAIHVYDLGSHLLGAPVSVSGLTANLAHTHVADYTVEDTSVAAVRYAGGALGSFCASNCAVPMEWKASFTLVCEKLTAHFTEPGSAEIIYTDREPVARETVSSSSNAYSDEITHFFKYLRGEVAPMSTIEDGLKSLETVVAVTKSAAQGGAPVALA
jgi:predicted dehydrogenase